MFFTFYHRSAVSQIHLTGSSQSTRNLADKYFKIDTRYRDRSCRTLKGGTKMELLLDDTEVRILGCLIEKEATTPEYYPLSLNSLTNACNQKSNRSPVVSYGEADVERALDNLIQKNLIRKTHTAGSRVDKYLHTFLDLYDFSAKELAALCELMLRGPQTLGEIRSRAGRMAPFSDINEVQNVLRGRAAQAPPLVIQLQRETGRKERRYAHLLSGNNFSEKPAGDADAGESGQKLQDLDRLGRLEDEIAGLRTQLSELKQAFLEFRAQF
jgi:uncharacterized protein